VQQAQPRIESPLYFRRYSANVSDTTMGARRGERCLQVRREEMIEPAGRCSTFRGEGAAGHGGRCCWQRERATSLHVRRALALNTGRSMYLCWLLPSSSRSRAHRMGGAAEHVDMCVGIPQPQAPKNRNLYLCATRHSKRPDPAARMPMVAIVVAQRTTSYNCV